jgi:hypothetical protein
MTCSASCGADDLDEVYKLCLSIVYVRVVFKVRGVDPDDVFSKVRGCLTFNNIAHSKPSSNMVGALIRFYTPEPQDNGSLCVQTPTSKRKLSVSVQLSVLK